MEELEVERLVIKDKTGAARIVLEVDRDGNPSITMRDQAGQERIVLDIARLGGSSGGSIASVHVKAGTTGPEVNLQASSEGLASAAIARSESDPGIQLSIGSDGNPAWFMYHPPKVTPVPDAGGYYVSIPEPMLGAHVLPSGEPQLVLLHQDGRIAFDTSGRPPEEGPSEPTPSPSSRLLRWNEAGPAPNATEATG